MRDNIVKHSGGSRRAMAMNPLTPFFWRDSFAIFFPIFENKGR